MGAVRRWLSRNLGVVARQGAIEVGAIFQRISRLSPQRPRSRPRLGLVPGAGLKAQKKAQKVA